MKHTIISWDCSFRNFFHLIPSLAKQEYNKDEFEVIYVEQRTREQSNKFNHQFGLESLWDIHNKYKDIINIKVIYLNEDMKACYHLSKCNNVGIANAKGQIVSIMDGDLLVQSDFLKKLDKAHDKKSSVFNLVRYSSQYPIGVKYYKDWMKSEVGFDLCLKACSAKVTPVPDNFICGNKGPLISAKKEAFRAIDGYDESIIFSTSSSVAGADVCSRLEIFLNTKSTAVPNAFCVHPWHPHGYASKYRKSNRDVKFYLDLQRLLIQWSNATKSYSYVGEREKMAQVFYLRNQDLCEDIIKAEVLEMESGPERFEKEKVLREKVKTLYKKMINSL